MIIELQFEKTGDINDINIVEVGEKKYEVMCKEFVRGRPVVNLHIVQDKKCIASTDKTKSLPRITNSSLETIIYEFNNVHTHKIKIKDIININRENKHAIFLSI